VAEHTEHIRYGRLDEEFVARLSSVTEADDAPFLMLNLMKYRRWADYADGRPRISGREADDLYAPLAVLADIGAEVVFFGDVVEQVRGDEDWDRVAIVRYPTVQSFIDMQDRPDFIAQHVHKDAGMERTIIALCHPVAGELAPRSRILVDLVADGELEPLPGQLLLRVEGSPVGDGRCWRTLGLTGLGDDALTAEHLAGDGTQATSVTVAALINTLP
jgi:hypothetical protein